MIWITIRILADTAASALLKNIELITDHRDRVSPEGTVRKKYAGTALRLFR